MKKITIVLFLLCTNLISAQAIITETFVEKWDNSKTYLLQMVEAMPEEKLNFKPSEREMSFKEQVLHILGNMDWLSGTYFPQEKYTKREFLKVVTKADLIAEIKASFDLAKLRIEANKNVDLSVKVDFFAGPKSKLQILNLMQDHVTHHRGQLIVYLNLCKIQPPKYVGW